jgi:hypothetical protein
MSDTTLEHILLAAIGAIPATIAAVSSLRNGRTMKENGKSTKLFREQVGKLRPSQSPGKN